MLGLMLASLALCGAADHMLGPDALVPPPALYPGAFDGPPVPHWSVDLPGGLLAAATHTERSNPLIYGDYVFVGAAAGTGLYMLARSDGRLVRHFEAFGSVESEPAIDGQRVYFADSTGRTWAYTLDGVLLWAHDAGSPVLVRPTIIDGRVFVTDVSDLTVALEARTGKLLWQYTRPRDVGRNAELALFAAPAAVALGDDVLVGFSDGAIVALDQVTGALEWDHRVGEGRYPDMVAAPIRAGTDIFASGYFLPLVAIDAETHNVRWRLDAGSAAPGVMTQVSGVDVLLHPGTDGILRAVVALTGAELWAWDSQTGGALSSPVLTDAGVLIGSTDGSLYLIDGVHGEEQWRYNEYVNLSGVTATPAVGGRQVIFTTNSGRIHSMLVPQPLVSWEGKADEYPVRFLEPSTVAKAPEASAEPGPFEPAPLVMPEEFRQDLAEPEAETPEPEAEPAEPEAETPEPVKPDEQ